MHKVLLTDGMQEVLDDLTLALGDHFEVCTCRNGRLLQQTMDAFRPDILLLDLTMGGYDPVAFLQSLHDKDLQVAVTGFYVDDYHVHVLEELGVEAVIIKPLNADGVAARLLKMELKPDRDENLKAALYEALLGAGVKLRYSGFTQLFDAILFACTQAEYSVTEDLYPYVAEKCGSTKEAVEKAISRCIEQAYRRSNRHLWHELFGQTGCPPNSVFIRQIVYGIMESGKT